MKKILIFSLIFFVNLTFAQQTLSHSISQTLGPLGTVSCSNTADNTTLDNSFWRSYTLSDFGITTNQTILGAEFGLSFRNVLVADPTVDVIIRVLTSDDVFPAGTFTEIVSKIVPVTEADNLTIISVTFDMPPTVTPNTEVIIQVEVPDGTAMYAVRVADNGLGENSPSYLSAPIGCAIVNPISLIDLGFTSNHMVINLVVDNVTVSVEDNNLVGVSVYPSPMNDVLNITIPSTSTSIKASIFDFSGRDTGINMINGTMNTSKLASGIYMFLLETNEGKFTTKVIKK